MPCTPTANLCPSLAVSYLPIEPPGRALAVSEVLLEAPQPLMNSALPQAHLDLFLSGQLGSLPGVFAEVCLTVCVVPWAFVVGLAAGS